MSELDPESVQCTTLRLTACPSCWLFSLHVERPQQIATLLLAGFDGDTLVFVLISLYLSRACPRVPPSAIGRGMKKERGR
jgi:hypothetical protein